LQVTVPDGLHCVQQPSAVKIATSEEYTCKQQPRHVQEDIALFNYYQVPGIAAKQFIIQVHVLINSNSDILTLCISKV